MALIGSQVFTEKSELVVETFEVRVVKVSKVAVYVKLDDSDDVVRLGLNNPSIFVSTEENVCKVKDLLNKKIRIRVVRSVVRKIAGTLVGREKDIYLIKEGEFTHLVSTQNNIFTFMQENKVIGDQSITDNDLFTAV